MQKQHPLLPLVMRVVQVVREPRYPNLLMRSGSPRLAYATTLAAENSVYLRTPQLFRPLVKLILAQRNSALFPMKGVGLVARPRPITGPDAVSNPHSLLPGIARVITLVVVVST